MSDKYRDRQLRKERLKRELEEEKEKRLESTKPFRPSKREKELEKKILDCDGFFPPAG